MHAKRFSLGGCNINPGRSTGSWTSSVIYFIISVSSFIVNYSDFIISGKVTFKNNEILFYIDFDDNEWVFH